jgi:hypothetical protein
MSEVESDSLVEGEDPDRTEDPNQLLQNIRFKATIRGWSHRTNQHRATALLSLQDEPMVRRIRENQDLVLLPVNWWSLANTLEPNESGWWYKVSGPIRFRECKACPKRIREDVQTGHKTLDTGVCPKCPIRKPPHEHSTRQKQGGNKQETTDKIVGVRGHFVSTPRSSLPENV